MKEYNSSFIQQLQQQDAGAFGQVYDEYVDIFFRYIKANYSLDDATAEDLLGDIFVKIRQALPNIKSDGSFSGFIWTVAKNHIKDYFKRSNEVSFSSMNSSSHDGDDFVREDTLADPAEDLSKYNEMYTYDIIHKTIRELDENYREALLLKFVEDMSYEEIAKILGISQDTARQRVSRGLKKLQELLSHIQ